MAMDVLHSIFYRKVEGSVRLHHFYTIQSECYMQMVGDEAACEKKKHSVFVINIQSEKQFIYLKQSKTS